MNSGEKVLMIRQHLSVCACRRRLRSATALAEMCVNRIAGVHRRRLGCGVSAVLSWWVSAAVVGAVVLGPLGLTAAAQQVALDRLAALRFRHIGPVGNRVSAVAGIAGNRAIFYVGAASGGIWKTVDAGLTWKPVFDDQPVHSIGALAVAPSDPNVVWAGTGETHIRSNVSLGNGVYRSNDGGASWRHMGLTATGRIGALAIHPTNPLIVYAAALGHAYGPQDERGVFRTTDGGETWERVLFVDPQTGASALIMDPANPRILLAGMWQLELKTWTRESGGAGSGLYRSADGGTTWTRLQGRGLPRLPVGKIGLCMSEQDADRVYALIETGDGVPWHGRATESGELWRSDDGGARWTLMTHNRHLSGRTPYYSHCHVAPDDRDEVYFLAESFYITRDGGGTFEIIPRGPAPGVDHHAMWIDPGNADRMIVGHDHGVSISENRGRSWLRVGLPIAQMYHATVDSRVPYYVYGNRQDGPSTRGPSNSRLASGVIPRGMWHAVGGGESGITIPDPVDPDVVWSTSSGSGPRGGIVTRYSERRRQFRQVEVWPEGTGGSPAGEVKYRFQFTFPMLVSPHDHNVVYVGSQHVHRTANGGQRWDVISPDLSTNDKTKQGISGGLTPENINVEYCCVIYALDESPVQRGVLWAGTNDGLVHISRDGGARWENVTANIPDLPPLGTVRNIDASKWHAGKAYLTVDFHEVGNFAPYAYKTEDFGRHWTKIVGGLPPGPVGYVRHIHEDPVRPGLLYLGTETALYVSFDDGASWQRLRNNLPPAPMYWLVVQEHFNDLVVGTYGRGFWILDDITPLQQLTPDVMGREAHFFTPRPAYRFRAITPPLEVHANANDPSAGEGPPYGASLNYWLRTATDSLVAIHIINAGGDTVRTLTGSGHAGINRVWWDLRYEPTVPIKLRTTPLYADWVDLGKERWRPVPRPQGPITMLAPPGSYTAALAVGGRRLTQPVLVRKDPHSEGTEDDIREQTELMVALRADMDDAANVVNRIEWIRRQLYDWRDVLAEREEMSDVIGAFAALDQRLIGIEGRLIQLKITDTGQDRLRWPTMLTGKIVHLAGAIAVSDFPPTDEQREMQRLLHAQLEQLQGEFATVLQQDVVELNRLLRDRGIPGIFVHSE